MLLRGGCRCRWAHLWRCGRSVAGVSGGHAAHESVGRTDSTTSHIPPQSRRRFSAQYTSPLSTNGCPALPTTATHCGSTAAVPNGHPTPCCADRVHRRGLVTGSGFFDSEITPIEIDLEKLSHPHPKVTRLLTQARRLLSSHEANRSLHGESDALGDDDDNLEFSTHGWGDQHRKKVFANSYVNMSNGMYPTHNIRVTQAHTHVQPHSIVSTRASADPLCVWTLT
jgi:hypothetical protein